MQFEDPFLRVNYKRCAFKVAGGILASLLAKNPVPLILSLTNDSCIALAEHATRRLIDTFSKDSSYYHQKKNYEKSSEIRKKLEFLEFKYSTCEKNSMVLDVKLL